MNKSYSALYRLSLRFSSQIWREAASNFKGAGKHDVLSRSPDLAKLKSKCHINYSIIFTEISFSSETSILPQKFVCEKYRKNIKLSEGNPQIII